MKKNMAKFVALLLVVMVPFFYSCSDNPSEPKNQQPPTVPPKSTMVMDFSSFTQTSLAKTDGKGNWLWAVGNVAFWNTALTLTLAVPVAAFVESFNHSPVLQPNGSWLWSYNFNIGALQYTAELYGKVSLNGMKWDMYVTLHGVFTEFHWFSGTSDLLATAGYWTMNLRPAEPVPFLQIDWTRDPKTQAVDITYTNIVPDGEENGSTIHQGFNQELPYTGLFDIYRVSTANKVEIKWNRETLEGRIKDPKHFSDDLWHCWDANLNDVECN
ncbi:hypothetical protein EH223_10360 [candidate division KSB1 bacterium]|nr:hypothetical protein [candidate division KSB1 bacterium]RQW03283.1 MAG: hypothetical protein EH223_10360 [candidate division KSB1 bacterium]